MKFLTFMFLAPWVTLAPLCAQPLEKDADWVDRRVAELQPAKDERRIDEVGWATSLGEAEKLARDHQRPVFLFTHDGRMALGRC
jgi:hypothetical protein